MKVKGSQTFQNSHKQISFGGGTTSNSLMSTHDETNLVQNFYLIGWQN